MSGLRVHHVNCATMCPVGCALMGRDHFVCHCLIVETDDGLVLVDTGLGLADIERDGLPRSFRWGMRPSLSRAESAVARIEALGFERTDVRHIVLTHLDLDHAGGLPDFPDAAVHLHRPEHRTVIQEGRTQFARHCPDHWAHDPDWRHYESDGEAWFDFEAVRDLEGLPPEILLIPLAGHSTGHSGIAVQTPDGWLLHAGDAYFDHQETIDRNAPFMLKVFQRALADDDEARVRNQLRLTRLAAEDDVTVVCAHDPAELEACCEG